LSDLDSNNRKRYVLAYQRGKVVLDKELTEQSYRDLDLLKRFLEKNIGDCALATSFKIVQSSVTTVSNFKITGGTIEKPAVLVVKGYPLVLFDDIEYNQQDATGSLTDDDYTQTVIPVISVPGTDRIDTVYVDTYLAEVSCEAGSEYLDASIKDIDLAIQSANRFRVVQDILVAENTTAIPADGYDINNVYHRYLKLAQIQRHTGNANILTTDITDSRKVVSTLESISDGTGDINVKNAVVQDDLTVHGTVTIIDETHTHSEKLVIVCDTAATDAISITKSNTGQALSIDKTDDGSGIIVNKPSGTGYAILVNTGSVQLPFGTDISEFSIDGTLVDNSDLAVPTEQAVKTYVDASIGGIGGTTNILAKFTGSHTVGDSNVSDDGSQVTISESYFTVIKDDVSEVIATVNNANDSTGKSSIIVDCNVDGDYKSLTLTQYNNITIETALDADASGAAVISSNALNAALYIEQKGAKPIYIGNDNEIRISIDDAGRVAVTGHLGVNMNSLINSMDVWGTAVFYDPYGRVTISDGAVRSSSITAEGVADYLSCFLLASGNYFEDRKFAFNLTDWSANNFYISRFGDDGIQLDSNVNPTFLIERSTGFIGINTSTFRGDALESLLTLYKDNAIRILGEQGAYNYGGTIFFGDGSNAYLKEYQDDYIEIMATQGYYFSGGPVGMGVASDVSYKLLISGNSRFFTYNKAIQTCDDTQDSVVVTQYLKDLPEEYVDASSVCTDFFFPANCFYVFDAFIYSAGERIRFSSTDTLPTPFSVDTDYYVILYDALHIQFAYSFEDAMNGFFVTITDQGVGIHSVIKRQVYSKHFVIDASVSTPFKLWSAGILNASEYGVGNDFYIARYDDVGNEIDSIYSRTFLINRSDGFVGINVREAQYQLDVNGSARFGNSDFGASVYAAGFFASGQYSTTQIGDWWKYFDYGYISDMRTSSIRAKTIGEGSTDGSLLVDLSTSSGQLITAGYYDGLNMMKLLSFSTDSLNPITSRKWSWSIQGTTGGHNSGANLYLYSHHNSGVENDVVICIKRSAGYVGIGVTNPLYALDTTIGNFSSQVRTPLLYPLGGSSSIGQTTFYFNNAYLNTSTISSINAKPISAGGDGYLKVINEIDGSKSFSTTAGQAGQAGVPAAQHVRHWCLVASATGTFSASDVKWSVGVRDVMYRRMFVVSGIVVTPAVGSVYTNNGSSWTVLTIDIGGGSGTIICWRSTGIAEPQASGNLTFLSGLGDAVIAFSSYTVVANGGSNFALWRHDDSGSEIDSPVLIDRQTGYTTFSNSVRFNDIVYTDRIKSNTVGSTVTFNDNIYLDGVKCLSDFTGTQKITTEFKFHERTRSEGLGYWRVFNRPADAAILNDFYVTTDFLATVGILDYLRITYIGFTACINGIISWTGVSSSSFAYMRYNGAALAFNPDVSHGPSTIDPVVGSCMTNAFTGVVTTHWYTIPESWLNFKVSINPGNKLSFCATYALQAGEPYLP
jgi:hypothetical protein